MADLLNKINDFFGLTPDAGKVDYDDYDDGYERRADSGYDARYSRDYDREDYDTGYDRRDEYARGYSSRGYERDYDDYDDDRGYTPRLQPLAEPVVPEHIEIAPRANFSDRYSEAREIGQHFRDGDIVTFDLSGLEMEEAKRYIDFAAGLTFALRGRIEREGATTFTILPEGVEMPAAGPDALSV
ncbi:cell division protein SepF [Corynebacterium sp. TAE3-ERU12]|uniref:cell division protein SepF n=1 Tax=Corynebacterium sp. TAE3-ERU12 TaxID=2849491 RepID=UPI001C45CEE2|nr:cell division protein SepF [Corynebacterium sp. TAE3-ERU12]MBV7296216.1 cell division protein SepF [Corynebacterium sp. TAE3-ERU12]